MAEKKSSVICVGEVMVELARGADGRYGLAFGGDTFNTAVYLARAGVPVGLCDRDGRRSLFGRLMSLAAAEGVNADLITRVPGRMPGLYLIETDAKGERKFYYWRDTSPARELFELPNWAAVAEALLVGAARLFLRRHAVALFQHRARPLSRRARARAPAGRQSSRSTAISARAAGRATWRAPARCSSRRSSASTSRCRRSRTRRCCGATPIPEATVARLQAFGIGEIVVKNGSKQRAGRGQGRPREFVPVPQVVEPVDTTAAGDSASTPAYLAARLNGENPVAAAGAAHRARGRDDPPSRRDHAARRGRDALGATGRKWTGFPSSHRDSSRTAPHDHRHPGGDERQRQRDRDAQPHAYAPASSGPRTRCRRWIANSAHAIE